jgi:hypothetical protein
MASAGEKAGAEHAARYQAQLLDVELKRVETELQAVALELYEQERAARTNTPAVGRAYEALVEAQRNYDEALQGVQGLAETAGKRAILGEDYKRLIERRRKVQETAQ